MVWIDEDHLFDGLKGGLGLRLRYGMGHIIGLKPEAQMDLDIAGSYIFCYRIKDLGFEFHLYQKSIDILIW